MRELVADNAAGNPLDVGQEIIHRFDFAFAAAHGELAAGPLNQVVEVFLRMAQGSPVGFFSLAALLRRKFGK